MPERQTIRLNRRTVLGAAGAVGTVAAGAGLGTRALFGDTESFGENDITAGELDLRVAWKQRYEFGGTVREETSDGWPGDLRNDADAPVVDLTDVKPGDSGSIRFKLQVDSNPGYLWLLGAEEADEERGTTEPETDGVTGAVPVGSEGELDELTEATLSYGTDGTTAYRTSLASLVGLGGVGNGVPLDGGWSTPVVDLVLGNATAAALPAGTSHELRLDWEVPVSVGNGVQSDSYQFTLGFYTEQARNNSR